MRGAPNQLQKILERIRRPAAEHSRQDAHVIGDHQQRDDNEQRTRHARHPHHVPLDRIERDEKAFHRQSRRDEWDRKPKRIGAEQRDAARHLALRRGKRENAPEDRPNTRRPPGAERQADED